MEKCKLDLIVLSIIDRSTNMVRMKKKTAQLQHHLGFWLKRISNEVHNAFVTKLEKAEISIPEWCVLIALYHGELTTPAQIAAQVGIDRAAISRTVEKLVKRGMIDRKVGEDRRYTPLELTQKALDLVPKLAGFADENEREFFFMLNKHEKEMLKSILLKIADQLGINTKES